MKFDEILHHLGNYGPYQRRIHLLACLIPYVAVLHLLGAIFTMGEPQFRCAIPGYHDDTYEIQNESHYASVNASIPKTVDGAYEKCKIYKAVDVQLALEMKQNNQTLNMTETIACSNWVYDKSVFTSTVVSEFDLVCENSGKTTVAGVVFMGGVLVGSFAFGVLSDAIGRKKTLVSTVLFTLLAGTGCAFSPDYYSFTIIRFFIGVGVIGLTICNYVIAFEWIGPKVRIFTALCLDLGFALGNFINTGLAYLIRDWRTRQLVVSLPLLLFLSYWWLIPESARWLLSKGREEEAEKIIRNAAKINKVELPEKLFDRERDDTELNETLPMAQLPRELIKAPKLLVRTLIMFFNWFAVSMVYYGLALNSGNIGGDIYVNNSLQTLSELPAILLALSTHWVGRKGPFVFGQILGGVSCICTTFVILYYQSNNTALIALSMVGRFGATNGFIEAYFWALEIYPTVVRNGLLGMSSVFARVGSMVSSPIGDLSKFVAGTTGIVLTQTIFGSVSIISGLLSLILPETRGGKLPESIEDCKTIDYRTHRKSSGTTLDENNRGIHLVPSDAAVTGEDNPALNEKDEEAFM